MGNDVTSQLALPNIAVLDTILSEMGLMAGEPVGGMVEIPQVDCPITNHFTPGLYIREIFMPKGSLILSRMHKTTHPYTISMGHCRVWTAKDGVADFKAPFTGITVPGTVRILYMHEDTVWTTYHPNPHDIEDAEELVNLLTDVPIIERRVLDV